MVKDGIILIIIKSVYLIRTEPRLSIKYNNNDINHIDNNETGSVITFFIL